MAKVFKRGQDKGKREAPWYMRYKDGVGKWRTRKGCTDKAATERMARKHEADGALQRSGLIDPRTQAFAAADLRPISSHIDDYQANILARGGTPKHAELTADRARRVAALAVGGQLADIDCPRRSKAVDRERSARKTQELLGEAYLSDLTPSKVQEALAALQAAGRALATCNHHRTAIRTFTRWAKKDGRLRDDPLTEVVGYNAKEDRRHDRRTISIEELQRLIDAAHYGPTYRRMTGSDRAICYRLAVATGLRYSEIASITPESFCLEGEERFVTVRASYTKNRQEARQNLPEDLVSDLSVWLTSKPKGKPVFDLPDNGAAMVRMDLAVAKIPFRAPDGTVFDFHSLRCQCATLADQADVSPRLVQRLMRHSSEALTNRYTRHRSTDIRAAVSALPSFRPSSETSAQAESSAANAQQPGDALGRDVSPSVVEKADDPATTPGSQPRAVSGLGVKRRPLTASVATSGVRTRTGDLRIMRPPL